MANHTRDLFTSQKMNKVFFGVKYKKVTENLELDTYSVRIF